MLQAGLDDSGKDGISPAFVLAGYLGSVDAMMALADEWRALLDETPKLDYLKGYEAFGLNGQFKNWLVKDRDDRLLKFVAAIAKYPQRGIAFVIDHKPFERIKQLKDSDGVAFKDPYELSYSWSIASLLQFLPHLGETKADIVFDRDLITRRQAARAYKRILAYWPAELADRLFRKEPHWEDDKQFLPLQAADLLAYCVRAIRDPDPRHDRVRNSPVVPALRSIPTVLAYLDDERAQYLEDRIKKGIPRQQIFMAVKW